ncbi:hypothetical protein LEP1GSC195_2149 [Leptospira wolbachii serovar Codice str. CDC]|uniref:Uncharacterized protein n=1 Tax=Leptospira wolbachii serovar Codice str. CDC TaxID=1218599 RepID=R9A1C4_9LEPT|nr:hypothetical protein LEP1GSC195_2149 [Leptospira wolbachii serovar Codice str. CDC]
MAYSPNLYFLQDFPFDQKSQVLYKRSPFQILVESIQL